MEKEKIFPSEKELDQLAKETTEENQYQLKQLQILKQGLNKLHTELTEGKNTYAAGYLGVTIDELQEVIDAYTKPLKISEKGLTSQKLRRD